MMISTTIQALKHEMRLDLIDNILPYWMTKMRDESHGGFYGQITGNEVLLEQAHKGGILNARILWTFSAAYNDLGDEAYRKVADRAFEYVVAHFFDEVHGGTYWSLKYTGDAEDAKKQIYSQAFFIYALSEYYRATGNVQSLQLSIELFYLIEKYSFDHSLNGYLEAFSRDWLLLDDLRLSDKDANERKTMNTHLHILEAYTNLYRIWKDETLQKQLENLVQLFLEKIIDHQSSHLNLFFNDEWESQSAIVSYGHDIEASWLLLEAAEVLALDELIEKVKPVCEKIVCASMEGLQADGSLIYEMNRQTGHVDFDRHWWPQSEAVVGFLNAYELTTNEEYISNAFACWKYIQNFLIDKQDGEWYWSILADGSINRADDKAGFWKCPYHNSRACLEIMRRVDRILA